ncbi:MAG: hypothetical protein FJZ57_05385, partial [Chlamydiae bacterium]|nr:hypothetical protein [Chlamydiota bacterium]
MLKFVSNLLNKASFFSSQIKTPSEEDPEQKPSFFVVVDLFIRQIHPMMDEVENLSEEKQASTDLSERTIQIMTKAQDGSATENRVEGVAIGYFKTAVTEGSYEQAALLNGNIVESYLQYNMPFTLQDLNYIDFASSKLYLPSYDDYKVDEMPVFFDMSLNDLMDSYEWHGSETIETGNSIISTGEQPEKKEPTSFYEELTNSSTIFRQNLGLFAFENTSALTFNENPSPSTIDRKHSELLLTPVPN